MGNIAEKTVETVTQAVKEAVDGAKYLQAEISGQRSGVAEISRSLEAIVSSKERDPHIELIPERVPLPKRPDVNGPGTDHRVPDMNPGSHMELMPERAPLPKIDLDPGMSRISERNPKFTPNCDPGMDRVIEGISERNNSDWAEDLKSLIASEEVDLTTPAPEMPSVEPVDESMFEQESESVDDLSL